MGRHQARWALASGFVGCSTSPPNLALGLLTTQSDSTQFVFGSLDIAANPGKSEFIGKDAVERSDGTKVFPKYQITPAGDVFCIPPIPWVLVSPFLNGLQPGVALGLNLYDWTSLAYIPTYSFWAKDWYIGCQLNQKLFRYAAISYTRYEEQLVAVLENPGWGEVGPTGKLVLYEVAVNFAIQLDFFGYPLVYSAIPKYTWSNGYEIEGAGLSTVLGFRL